eukprot:TRINITY_DN893_c6_g1_i1.p1 TRINITY_DN893_c6_g1~~TRINITY_DN893_c6_g1_i1.p1  ORF type:complete len:610 (+),score=123.17 TRINITY_DN893_c6_g1_i1:75-1904(+)
MASDDIAATTSLSPAATEWRRDLRIRTRLRLFLPLQLLVALRLLPQASAEEVGSYGYTCFGPSLPNGTCGRHDGALYSWCSAGPSGSLWDYCAESGETSSGWTCRKDGSPGADCAKHEEAFSWCYTTNGQWDYCVIRVLAPSGENSSAATNASSPSTSAEGSTTQPEVASTEATSATPPSGDNESSTTTSADAVTSEEPSTTSTESTTGTEEAATTSSSSNSSSEETSSTSEEESTTSAAEAETSSTEAAGAPSSEAPGTATTPGGRISGKGCACKKAWSFKSTDCDKYCCNPDDDILGEWCYLEDPACEGADWAYCLREGSSPALPPLWEVKDGNCKIDARGCATSPNYPEDYTEYAWCKIELLDGTTKRPVYATDFHTEYSFDIVRIDGTLAFSGVDGPQGVIVNASLTFNSDEDIQMKGWRICPEEVVPLGFKPPAPQDIEPVWHSQGWSQALFFACDPSQEYSQLVARSWVCDGEDDCDNGADEANCTTTTSTGAMAAAGSLRGAEMPSAAAAAAAPPAPGPTSAGEEKGGQSAQPSNMDNEEDDDDEEGMPTVLVGAVAILATCGSAFAYSRGYCASCCGSGKGDYYGTSGTAYGRSYRDMDSL